MNNVIKNYGFSLLLTFSNLLFPIIIVPYISRILGPEQLGKVQFIQSFAQYFVMIAALGIPVYGVREIAKNKSELNLLSRVASELLLINFICSLLFFLIYICIITSSNYFSDDYHLYLLSGLLIFFSFANIDWLCAGLENNKYIAIRSLIIKSLTTIFLYICVNNRNDIIYYLYINVGLILLNNLINIFYCKKYIDIKGVGFNSLISHIKPLSVIFISIAFASVYSTLDGLVLGFIKGYKELGIFLAASRLSKMTIPVLSAMSSVLLPVLALAVKDKNFIKILSINRTSVDIVFFIGIPMTLGLFLLSPELIFLFCGNEFSQSVICLRIMSPFVLIIGLSTVFALQIMSAAGLDSKVTFAVFIGLIYSLLLNLILIPRFGYLAATVVNLTSEMLVMILFYKDCRKIVDNLLNIKKILNYFLVSILFVPIVFFVKYIFKTSLIIVLISIVFCFSYYLVVNYFLKNDLMQNLKNMIIQRYAKL